MMYHKNISRTNSLRYFRGKSIPAMSMIYHEISWWDISVVQVIHMIQVIQLIHVMQVRLGHLWPSFRFFLREPSTISIFSSSYFPFSFQRTPFKLHILWAENFPFRQGGWQICQKRGILELNIYYNRKPWNTGWFLSSTVGVQAEIVCLGQQ